MKSRNVEVKAFDHVEDLESELRSCCESSSSNQNCEVNLFPGLQDANTAPSCADRRLVKECKFANLEENRCSDYCTSQGSLFSRGPHVCGDSPSSSSSSSCVNGASLDNEARYKCRDECGKNTEPPKIPQTCDDLIPVRSCKSLGHSKEECEISCMCGGVRAWRLEKQYHQHYSRKQVRITALFSLAMHIVVNS